MNEMETVNYSQDTIDNSYVRSLVKSYFTLISWFIQKTVLKNVIVRQAWRYVLLP